MSDSREAFEAWAHANVAGFSGAIGDNGDYCYDDTEQDLWEAWQHQQEHIAELEAERDQLREQNAALAAHVERCNKIIDSWGDCEISCDDAALRVADWRGDEPATSLARIRAEAKVDALEDVASKMELGSKIRKYLYEEAAQYRKQAEGE